MFTVYVILCYCCIPVNTPIPIEENMGSIEKNKVSVSPKGICYFDIDDTLTSAIGDKEELMKECLDNNFAIGIVTASGRKIEHMCDGDNPTQYWMPKTLCKQFNKDGGKMYNSATFVGGKSAAPPNYPHNEDYGYKKGFDMEYGRKTFYPDIQKKCVVLFDDQTPVMDGVHRFDSELETQCANKVCGLSNNLDISIVKSKVSEMVANGCK